LLKLGMYRRDNGELIGMVQLFNLEEGSRRGEIGYCLAKSVQGRGYMDEALTCFIDYLAPPCTCAAWKAEIDRATTVRHAPWSARASCWKARCARWCVAGELSDSGLYGLLLEPPVA
jgi:hypothetical protein